MGLGGGWDRAQGSLEARACCRQALAPLQHNNAPAPQLSAQAQAQALTSPRVQVWAAGWAPA